MNSRFTASLRNQNGFAWAAGVMLIGAIALVGLFAQTASATNVEKVNICHGTSSDTNPWNAIQVDASALATHLNDGDFLYSGPTKDNGKPENGGDEWCEENAPKVEVDLPSECTPNEDLVIVSDEDTQVDGNDAYVTDYPHSAWVSNVVGLDSTNWIWDTEKSSLDDNGSHPAGTLTFTREFEIEGTPTGAELLITADNEYEVSINGNVLGDDDVWQSVEPYSIDASLLLEGETNTLEIVAVNAGPDGVGNPAGLNFKLTVESEDCPEPVTEATLHAQKIVCDDESDLPNWGAGNVVGSIGSTTASDWMNDFGSNLGCELVDWDFQWGYATQTTDPDDGLADAGAGWNTFSGSELIDVANENNIRIRESADADYVGFTGQVTDQDVSAEVYCGTDVLHYDNWEWIDGVVAGEDYYCVAWNVPLEQPEPNFCEGNLLVNGGFEEDVVTDAALWQLFASIPGWMVDWTDGNENDTPMFELQAGVLGWLPSEGNQYIELDSDRPDTLANTKIWQDIATDDEKTYALSYQFSPRPNTTSADNKVEVYWNGNLVDSVEADNFTGNTVWTLEGATGLAGAVSSSSLEFRSVGTSNEYGAFVDEVCLVEVPEEACRLEVVSLAGDEGVLNGDAVEAWNHPLWATNLNAFADWIWDTEYVNDPEVDEARTFAKSFWVTGPVNDATLTFAADNRYWIEINGDAVLSDSGEFNYGATQSINVSTFIDEDALNTIVMKIENIGIEGETQQGNPAAGIYQLIINAEEENVCEPVEIPECSDNIDNDNDGYTDFAGQDLGCEDGEDDDEYNEPEGPDYGPYCGNGEVDQEWEQCDPGLVSRDSISIDDAPSCNQYCQFDNQCSDLVVARINTDNLVNTYPEYGADMTEDVWLGGDEEGVDNIPGWAWFAVYYNGSAVDDLDFGAYDANEDVPGYAVNRDEDMIRVRMHGDHDNEYGAREHAEGSIEIRHAFTDTSVLTAMKNQLAGNAMEFPFNGTVGSVTNPRNDELNLGGLGNFWMVVGPEDDGFRAEYVVGEELSCEQDPTPTSEMVIVTPSDLEVTATPDVESWYFWNDVNDTPSTTELAGEYEFVTGPGTPNLPVGSVQMSVNDSERWNISTNQFAGLDLADIEAMSFDTYQPSTNVGPLTEAIYLNFDVDFSTTTTTGYQGRLVFVPADQGGLTQDTWENHDAFNGMWRWSGYDANGSMWPDSNVSATRSWASIMTAFPDAEVFNESFGGQLLFRAGEPYPAGFTGAVDNFVIEVNNHTTTYNFEPEEGDEEHIIVVKNVTEGSDSETSFHFNASWDVDGFSLTGGDQHDSGDLEPGVYDVSEVVPEGWTLEDATCYSSEDQVETLVALDINPSELVLSEGETITCYFTNDEDEETPETPDEPNNSTSKSNGRRGGSSSTGRVLGATTEGFCPFLRDYLHINMQNDPSEVNKAKAFFNSYLGKALILDGVFDKDMFAAAVEFQNMFSGDVLDTWVEEFAFLDDNATGYIYQTTKWKINSIMCPGYEAFPDQLIVANGTTVNL